MQEWTRIPNPIEQEADRRAIAAILTACELEVRIVKEKPTKNGSYKRFVEYKPMERG